MLGAFIRAYRGFRMGKMVGDDRTTRSVIVKYLVLPYTRGKTQRNVFCRSHILWMCLVYDMRKRTLMHIYMLAISETISVCFRLCTTGK